MGFGLHGCDRALEEVAQPDVRLIRHTARARPSRHFPGTMNMLSLAIRYTSSSRLWGTLPWERHQGPCRMHWARRLDGILDDARGTCSNRSRLAMQCNICRSHLEDVAAANDVEHGRPTGCPRQAVRLSIHGFLHSPHPTVLVPEPAFPMPAHLLSLTCTLTPTRIDNSCQCTAEVRSGDTQHQRPTSWHCGGGAICGRSS